MGLSALTLTVALVYIVAASPSFSPLTVPLSQLQSESLFDRDAFVEALSSYGMVAVSGIAGFREVTQRVVRSAEECTTTSVTSTFEDGTVRKTLAIASDPKHAETFNAVKGECEVFEKEQAIFRELVAKTLEIFASKLSSSFQKVDAPFLKIGSRTLNNFSDLIQGADILEHFHSFRVLPNTSLVQKKQSEDESLTLDWHTDRGLLLVFTPALLASASVEDGFMVRLPGGAVRTVNFGPEVDLVFMFGDAVHQLVNPLLLSDRLGSTVHALKTPQSTRWWYGRMVLPPGDAIHAASGLSYRALHQLIIEKSYDEVLEIGCSSSLLRPLAVGARSLLQDCQANQLNCWSQCVDVPLEIHDYCVELDQEPECSHDSYVVLPCINKTIGPSPATSALVAAPKPQLNEMQKMYLGIGIAVGLLVVAVGVALCLWTKRRAAIRHSVLREEVSETNTPNGQEVAAETDDHLKENPAEAAPKEVAAEAKHTLTVKEVIVETEDPTPEKDLTVGMEDSVESIDGTEVPTSTVKDVAEEPQVDMDNQ